ncbi:Rpn family recombination-promoting nuclease/putative transposase [Oceanobacillus sp. HCA-5259]|uniref:Rpn family recombination-promoting nuclease/putative transposase n=1 Tax=Oceanobacillus sp. HCA-5259 TaxID=3134661 RepID=UPI0030C63870
MELTRSLRQYPLENIIHDTVRDEPADYGKNKSDFSSIKKFKALKRIPLSGLMDLKIDYAFKQLFGIEKNKQITIVFLNEFLQKTGRDPIKDITFINIEAGGEYIDDKQSRLDVLVLTTAGEKINVEIQFTDQYNMIKRSIYYWSGVYRSQLRSGMGYDELSDVISINLLNFNIFDQTERFHTMHHLFEDEEQFKLTGVMEFHYIEMPKLLKAWKEDQLDPWNDVLARWLLLLGMIDHRNKKFYEDIYRELEEIAMEDKTLQKAFHNWEELSMTPEQYLAYESRLKHILDEEAAKREAELRAQEAEKDGMERGMKRGMKRGIEQGMERGEEKAKKSIAQRLLSDGTEIQYVMNITGLSKEEVLEIQKDIAE